MRERDEVQEGVTSRSQVVVETGGVLLEGELVLPPAPRGVVLFAHGSGSSRHSPRNRKVAATLQEADLGTLLFDLLTPDEERVDRVTAELRFDIPLLALRLVGAVDWVRDTGATRGCGLGLFGASTGAAAALIAAAERPESVGAVVSRGGRPDLAEGALTRVQAPTLLIVGSLDYQVIELNRRAAACLHAPHEVAIVPGATHLFEEPGALEQVSSLATDWFLEHVSAHDRERTRPAR